MATQTLDVPVANIGDRESVAAVIEALRALHGPAYEFAVGEWAGETRLEPPPGRTGYRFIIETEAAEAMLRAGDLVRGPAPGGPYRRVDGALAELAQAHTEALWPGDVVAVDERTPGSVTLYGRGIYFEVITEQTGYLPPRLALLRHLADRPGGCAAYPDAFRRETLPPVRPAPEAQDRRGVNRVNEHTLDMRFDRNPLPKPHYHGQIPVGPGQSVNHSETAIVLRRSTYHLPEVSGGSENGRIVIYRRPAEDPTDKVIIPVRPGSIVVTPAAEQVMGHFFENAFAMLVAIPGFVSPSHLVEV
jgi:hypothetical protein